MLAKKESALQCLEKMLRLRVRQCAWILSLPHEGDVSAVHNQALDRATAANATLVKHGLPPEPLKPE